MQTTSILTSLQSISLTYNLYDNSLSGISRLFATLLDLGDEPADNLIIDYYSDPIFIFTPNFLEIERPFLLRKPIDISIDDSLIDLVEGDYTYNMTLVSLYAQDKIVTISLKVIDDSSAEPEPIKEYYLKYKLEHTDVDGNETLCEIQQLEYLGEVIPIRGYVSHNYQSKTDLFEPIIASNIKLELESNLQLTLSDLYSEEEKEFRVILKRNNQVIFIGFIKPDGIYEDYVFDKWMLSIDAYDGLSTLKNLSFVNENGLIYAGRYNVKDIILNCIKRTGLNLPLNINCNLYYDTFSGNNSLEETIFNTSRYYENASDPMNCEDVLKSTLQVFNLTIIQMFGEWWVYRSIDVSEDTIFSKYIGGIYDSDITLNPIVTIGSQIDDYDIIHCNSNQKKSIGASVQAYKVIYQYGNAKSIYQNPELQLSGGGLDIEGWGVNNFDGEVERQPSGYGLISKTLDDSYGDPTLLYLTQSIDINAGAVIKLIVQFGNYLVNTYGLRFAIGVGSKFFNLDNESWQDGGHINTVLNATWDGYTYPGSGARRLTGLGRATYELVLRAPISGPLVLTIYRDKHSVAGGFFDVYSVDVVPNDSGNIKGREYTAQRKSKISTVTKQNVTVYNGDSVSDLFVGTIYKSDADTPTEKWYRGGITESKELLAINAEDNLRMSPRPMTIFEGDIYGYIPYLSLISINNFEGKQFQPINYSYQTNVNILKLSSKEFSNAYIPETDFTVAVKDNYGNEQNVSIT